ncbi:hypothetical protein H1235_05215 [Pseudoxanthomonas sp. NC8]|nr:hypothetical protein H1235_05215 [Pseudoxanthomonas sp. NC8]
MSRIATCGSLASLRAAGGVLILKYPIRILVKSDTEWVIAAIIARLRLP